METICCYQDFVDRLLEAGFSVGGENDEGVFGLSLYFADTIQWHTGVSDTDPWEWRMRVLEQRDDILYGKVFFGKSGFITKAFYPYFYAVRRGNDSLEDAYWAGTISAMQKRVYDLFDQNDTLALHEMKRLLGLQKEEKSAFERALTQLQMGLYLTMCGRTRKRAMNGAEYGWNATVFRKTDGLFGLSTDARDLPDRETAYRVIRERIALLRPDADEKKCDRFIRGSCFR